MEVQLVLVLHHRSCLGNQLCLCWCHVTFQVIALPYATLCNEVRQLHHRLSNRSYLDRRQVDISCWNLVQVLQLHRRLQCHHEGDTYPLLPLQVLQTWSIFYLGITLVVAFRKLYVCEQVSIRLLHLEVHEIQLHS